jgi:hypothetical protein
MANPSWYLSKAALITKPRVRRFTFVQKDLRLQTDGISERLMEMTPTGVPLYSS